MYIQQYKTCIAFNWPELYLHVQDTTTLQLVVIAIAVNNHKSQHVRVIIRSFADELNKKVEISISNVK